MSAETKQKKQKLDDLLTRLGENLPLAGVPRGSDSKTLKAVGWYSYHALTETVSEHARWPTTDDLFDLQHTVHDLAMAITQRKKPFVPYCWKAYKVVDKNWPSIRLVTRLDRLVNRARERLQKTGVSQLERLRREDYEGAQETMRLWNDLKAFGGSAWKADEIEWERHEKVLFSRSDNELVRPGGDDSAALRRLKCYARALELMMEDELYYQPLRRQARPLLNWIAIGDNPNYYDLLKWDYHSEWLSGFAKETFDDMVQSEKRHRQLAQQRFRQSLHRLRAIFTSRERAALAKCLYHQSPGEFRAKVSEADYVRKISR
jgi:hypothetical protein